jgi:hypothetical protein
MPKQLQEIEVTIMPDGKTKIEAKGFKGDACLKETAALEAALGSVKDREMKPEAREKVAVTDTIKQRG